MFDAVHARAVEKVYGRQRGLAPVTLRFGAGEAVALLGPNGAGKSTLVGILATLIAPSAGDVVYGDAPADDDTRRHIGVIAHESLCYGDLTARENLRFFARLYGVAGAAARAEELCVRVGLAEEAASRPARTYSRGMLQRLAIARALVHRPRLLLADEPFTGLDRDGVALIGRLLAEEKASGAIVVVVTHDFDAVAGLADRVVMLARGRVVHDAAAPPTAAAFTDVYRAKIAR
jgi:heme exporter protein A